MIYKIRLFGGAEWPQSGEGEKTVACGEKAQA
jgi:hypothetical protein